MANSRRTLAVLFGAIALAGTLACRLIGLPAVTPTAEPNPTAVISDCVNQLDDETTSRLEFSLGALFGEKDLPAGTTYTITLGVVECCYIYQPVEVCATWSVEATAGVAIDPVTGVLQVSSEVPGGSAFTVSADVENGRRIITETIHVYTLESHPLVRLWSETAQLACDGGAEIVPDELMSELVFRADGEFMATWHPFETYVDYWGTYVFDLNTHSLSLEITGGNYIPSDVDLSGTFRLDETGRLILEGIWLGSPPSGPVEGRCGHIFG